MAPSSTGTFSTSDHVSESPKSLLPGVYVPAAAFFSSDDSVDVSTTKQHAIRLAEAGVTGIVTHGSNGEAVHLDHEERMLINTSTREALDSIGRQDLPLIVGCGAQSTKETILLCKEAAKSGGTYAIILPPAYYGFLLTTELIMQHFRDVADASPIPLLIYNFPSACNGLDLDSDVIISLSAHPNIVGVKLTCGNTGKLARVAAGTPDSFTTMGGSADFLLQTLVVGGQGVIAGLANISPRACVKLMKPYEEGNIKEARKMQALIARGDWVAIKGGFVSIKVALEAFYGYGGLPRKPCAVVGNKSLTKMRAGFEELIELEKSL